MPTNLSKRDEVLLQLLGLYHLTSRTMRDEFSNVLRGYDATPRQFFVLSTLYRNGSMHINEIIDQMSSTSGNMTVVIRNMERDGYITRIADPNDRRSSLISLSDKGATLIKELIPRFSDYFETLLSVLTSDEQNELTYLLKKLNNVEENA